MQPRSRHNGDVLRAVFTAFSDSRERHRSFEKEMQIDEDNCTRIIKNAWIGWKKVDKNEPIRISPKYGPVRPASSKALAEESLLSSVKEYKQPDSIEKPCPDDESNNPHTPVVGQKTDISQQKENTENQNLDSASLQPEDASII